MNLTKRREVQTERGLMDVGNFLWRTKDSGQYLRPCIMKTSHLFFTLRMIYNNTVPEIYRHPPVRLYTFDSFYTKEYLTLAVIAMLMELSNRNDMTAYFKRALQFMKDNIDIITGRAEKIDFFEGEVDG